MEKLLEKFDIYINQNIIILIIGFLGLGFSELNNLQGGALYYLSLVLSIAGFFSVGITLKAYTGHYCQKRKRLIAEEKKEMENLGKR
jgi:hypothetical protein